MTTKKEDSVLQTIIKGPSLGYTDNFQQRGLWEEIAKEFNGEFKITHTAGNELEIHRISIPYKKWTILISVSDSKPLKFHISFSASLDFELILSWDDFIERIVRKFSHRKMKLGWTKFDKQYQIKSNRSDLVRRTITTDVQRRLLKHELYSLSYETDMKSRTAEFISVVQRTVGSKEMIVELIELHKLLIDNFEELRIIE